MPRKRVPAPSFAYVIGARDECTQLPSLFDQLQLRLSAFPGSQVVLVENGSTDGTFEKAEALARDIHGAGVDVRRSEPGLGNAIRAGLRGLRAEFTVITAADLPFGFSDLDAFIERGCPSLATGSKDHPESSWPVGDRRRTAMSRGFASARSILFGLDGLDTQGSVFVRTALLDRVADHLVSRRYFISTEIVLRVRALGEPITHMPVSAPTSVVPRGSHVTLASSAGVLWEMIRVRATLPRRQPDAAGGTRNTA
jgi:hypothetical protein